MNLPPPNKNMYTLQCHVYIKRTLKIIIWKIKINEHYSIRILFPLGTIFVADIKSFEYDDS